MAIPNVNCCYSQANKRELLADYALPVAVLSFSFIGSVVFDKVSLEQFDATEVNKHDFYTLNKGHVRHGIAKIHAVFYERIYEKN